MCPLKNYGKRRKGDIFTPHQPYGGDSNVALPVIFVICIISCYQYFPDLQQWVAIEEKCQTLCIP